MKIQRATFGSGHPRNGQHYAWLFWCPACNDAHQFDERWTFDGNMRAPTFAPSLVVEGHTPQGYRKCHLFLTAGRIEYLSDCEHVFAGRTLELPDWPYGI